MYQTAQYGTYWGKEQDPNYAKKEEKGKNCICVLAIGKNEPKDADPVGAKVCQVAIENYLRRPSLRDEALDHIAEFALNGIMVAQRPGARTECSSAILLFHTDSFRWSVCGDVRVNHYVDGQIVHSSGRCSRPALGADGGKETDKCGATAFSKGENSFLLCSESFSRYVSDTETEDALSRADNPEEWLRLLREMMDARSGGEDYALMCVFAPSRRKRKLKKPVVILIILVAVAVIAFAVLGAVRRSQGPGGPGGPGQGPGGQQPAAMGTQPPPPTRPPLPEGMTEEDVNFTEPPQPTEPAAPPEGEAPAA